MAFTITEHENKTRKGSKEFESIGDVYYRIQIDGKDLSKIADSYDVALLMYLEHKYLGINSQFVKFACRMLGIKSAWSE